MTAASPLASITTVAIVDPCCASGYTPACLLAGGLGGTEATVLRIAGALAQHAEITHFQNGRDHAEVTEVGHMLPLPSAFAPRGDMTFVVINSWKVACKLRKVHPQARILLWMHIHPGRHNRPMAKALNAADIGVICVSQSHASHLRAFLAGHPSPRIDHIYNPIADDLGPDATPRDPDRLLFASSPHKGLAQVFAQFWDARSVMSGLTLAVADPGYLAWDTGPVPEGVRFLGTLSQDALICEMRRSLCLFYPQTTFAETFGLVLAESNAVGTPVLVHRDLGANAEVAGDPAQLVDGNDPAQILERLRHWRETPPVVRANHAFRLSAVAQRWVEMLALDKEFSVQSRKVA